MRRFGRWVAQYMGLWHVSVHRTRDSGLPEIQTGCGTTLSREQHLTWDEEPRGPACEECAIAITEAALLERPGEPEFEAFYGMRPTRTS